MINIIVFGIDDVFRVLLISDEKFLNSLNKHVKLFGGFNNLA